MEALLVLLGGLALVAVTSLYFTLSWAYVCFKFWYWFILPVFTDLPHCTFIQCIGLMFFIGLFKQHTMKENKDDEVNWPGVILLPWISLLIGAAFYSFMY